MTTYTVRAIDNKNKGIAREWALCAYYGIERTHHDSLAYDKGSDLDTGDKHISIKATGFTLMSGHICYMNNCETFDEIWNLYETRVHSNTFAYVTADFQVYEMNLVEFKEFVYRFCYLNRESAQHGGYKKIKSRSESKKMLAWLAQKSA